jgi:ABC-type branched-subunit amino acid transport system ATPase component
VRLFEQMTVLDNILVVLTERPVARAFFEKHGEYHLGRAHDMLKRVGLWEKRGALARNLSYGQRKLLEIARALSMNAQLYLFDEPFAGLFKEMVKTVVAVMKQLREEGKTVLLIEHNMELIRELSDWVIVMDSGKLLAEGKPTEVFSRKEVIEAYLGE